MQRCDKHGNDVDRRFDALLVDAMEQYHLKQVELGKELAAFGKWHHDLDNCTIEFAGDGVETRTESITPIATYMPSADSWLWCWADDALPERAREKSLRLKELNARTQYKTFDSPSFNVSLKETDQLCALALHELKGKGVFKVKDAEPWLFLVVD